MSVNKVILIGNVGKDPEVNYIKEDLPVAKFTLATSESYTKDGQKVTNTEWHNIVVWRGLAKVVEKYVKKGSKLYIEGKITNRQYEKDGQTKYFTEIVVRDLTMLDSKNSSGEYEGSAPAASAPAPAPAAPTQEADDDLPF
jgi:single-strand DNA-binding protein